MNVIPANQSLIPAAQGSPTRAGTDAPGDGRAANPLTRVTVETSEPSTILILQGNAQPKLVGSSTADRQTGTQGEPGTSAADFGTRANRLNGSSSAPSAASPAVPGGALLPVSHGAGARRSVPIEQYLQTQAGAGTAPQRNAIDDYA